MELFEGKTLVAKDGSEVQAEDVLAGKEIIALYFSAYWCEPCRHFTPFLAEAYGETKDAGYSLEVIFVSADESADEMLAYMEESHGDWYALQHGDELVKELDAKFNEAGLPSLTVLKNDGTVITPNGRHDVQDRGAAAFQEWFAAV